MTWAKPDLSLAFKKKLEMGFSERVGEGGSGTIKGNPGFIVLVGRRIFQLRKQRLHKITEYRPLFAAF
jgi:hypothetical protein